jgi:Ca-activated chloride channel family protein
MGEGPKLTFLGKISIGLFVIACLGATYYLFFRGKTPSPDPGQVGQPVAGNPSLAPTTYTGPIVEIGIAYGTEKKNWLTWAVHEFAATPEGQKIKINLIPKGSLEGAQAVYRDNDKRINVWSPASALFTDVFVQEWQAQHGNNPILREEKLALTPMVFVLWDERYQALARNKRYTPISFGTIRAALQEKEGWQAIAMQPDWGLFKFSHTYPNQSNSGLMALVLLAYDHFNKSQGLVLRDILDKDFQADMEALEKGMSHMSHSTGDMMKDMVLYGPSKFDGLMVYESVVIDYLKPAAGKWGGLRVIYPRFNLWSDNPYYVLDVPWSSADQRQAAQSFLEFLMSDRIQKEALTHGFRPGNVNVPIRDIPDSPFVRYADAGLKIDVPNVIYERPNAEVINNLLEAWRRLDVR